MTEKCSLGFEGYNCMNPILVRPMRLISAYRAGHRAHASAVEKLRAENAELRQAVEDIGDICVDSAYSDYGPHAALRKIADAIDKARQELAEEGGQDE